MAFLGSIAMMGLSLDALTKERTSGALDLILTRPVGRRQVIVGKLLAFYSLLGVAISLFCRTLQSAFTLGGSVWVFFSPLVWEFLVLRGLQRHLDDVTLSWLNIFNPVGAYFSSVWYVDKFGAAEFMELGAPTWVAYCVLILDVALAALFALLLFDRQEEPGYRE